MNGIVRIAAALAAILILPAQSVAAHGEAPSGATPTVAVVQAEGGAAIRHAITLDIDPATAMIRISDEICCFGGGSISLAVNSDARIERVAANGRPAEFELMDSDDAPRVKRLIVAPDNGAAQGRAVTVALSMRLPSIDDALAETIRGVSFSGDGAVGPEWAYLPASAIWYPLAMDEGALFDVTVRMPAGYTAVMEGEWLSSKEEGGLRVDRWRSSDHLDGVNVVIGRFHVTKTEHAGTEIYTFFLSDDDELSALYTKKVKGYLDLYASRLTPYPFKKFAVVESLLPTGFGMPSYTLLGSSVLRLPFIPETALGHEFAHNWWGNSVFVDYAYGNWAEALASYTADHLYKELEGASEASAYRKRALDSYRSYASALDMAVKDFKDGRSSGERAVGYGKGLFVFHMLRGMVGDDAFYAALRRFHRAFAFRHASFADVIQAFEAESGMSLGHFFNEWVVRPGEPSIAVSNAAASMDGSEGYVARLTIEQSGDGYAMRLPVVFETDGGVERRVVMLDAMRRTYGFNLKARPRSVTVDPDHDVFRLLSATEVAPILSAFLGDADGLIVLPSDAKRRALYGPLAESISSDYGQRVVVADELTVDDALKRSLFVVGAVEGEPLFDMARRALVRGADVGGGAFTVGGRSFSLKDSVVVVAGRDHGAPSRALVLLTGGGVDEKGVISISRRIPHLTSKGWLVFGRERAMVNGVFDVDNALRMEIKVD